MHSALPIHLHFYLVCASSECFSEMRGTAGSPESTLSGHTIGTLLKGLYVLFCSGYDYITSLVYNRCGFSEQLNYSETKAVAYAV